MAVYFLRPEDWIPGLAGIPLAKITGIVILFALAFSFHDIHWQMPQEVAFLVLLVVQLWLAAAFSPVWRGGSIRVMLDFSKVLPLVVVMFAAVRSMKRLRKILFVQAAAVATIAISSIVSQHTSGGRLQSVLFRMWGDPNDLAVLIALSLPICLAFALTAIAYWKKLVWTVAIFSMIYAVFLTASRAGAIALVVAVLACLWQLGVKSRRYYVIFLLPLVVVSIWVYGGSVLRQRFEQTSKGHATTNHSSEAFGSAQQRKELLFKSLRVTAEHPLLGVGPGNFEEVSGMWHVTHNSYTQMSAEGGIPAFLLYLLIFMRSITNLKNVRKYRTAGKGINLFSMALEASLAAYLVGSFFLNHAYLLFPYCLVAYTSALLLIAQRNREVSTRASKSQAPPTQVEMAVWH